MTGLVPPAQPKPLRRGEGPAIHAFSYLLLQGMDVRHKAGHDAWIEKRPMKSGCGAPQKTLRAV
ncbi:hypothetical protein D4Q52_16020 [Rhodopseudomonas palustris]|uniref:Uncharacterized protein n=1 Tax=Rhodopseudomonas palustris TaxID=1076 RepID=A0A418V3A5_RHOPL|nr:hypothetical protein D4Q52_16020 [Rhodopseudomonas palustris]